MRIGQRIALAAAVWGTAMLTLSVLDPEFARLVELLVLFQ